jgi:hypothetical protein
MFKFYIRENSLVMPLEYINYYTMIHDALMIMKNKCLKTIIFDVCLDTCNKTCYPIIIETYYMNDDFNVISKKGIKYDLSNFMDLYTFLDLFCDMTDLPEDKIANKYIIQSICDLLKSNKKNNETQQKNITPINNVKKNDKSENKDLIKNIADTINETIAKKSVIHIDPTILSVPFKDKNENKKQNDEDNDDLPDFEIEKIRRDIEKLEKTKEIMENAIENFKEELDEEEKNLTKYEENLNDEMKQIKKKEENINKNLSVFISEKEYTYKKIYNIMMESGGVNFEEIPDLFISKFPIFLFMDGKDCEGNNVRERLLDTENEYHIYNLLYNAITDENFEIPENENDSERICEFINFLPNGYQAITPDDIMKYNNKKSDNLAHVMFKEDETEAEDCEELEKNEMYNMK